MGAVVCHACIFIVKICTKEISVLAEYMVRLIASEIVLFIPGYLFPILFIYRPIINLFCEGVQSLRYKYPNSLLTIYNKKSLCRNRSTYLLNQLKTILNIAVEQYFLFIYSSFCEFQHYTDIYTQPRMYYPAQIFYWHCEVKLWRGHFFFFEACSWTN